MIPTLPEFSDPVDLWLTDHKAAQQRTAKRAAIITNTATITIPLTRGQFTVVDTIDADLARFNWQAKRNTTYPEGKQYAAARSVTYEKAKKRTEFMHRVILSRKLGRPLLHSERVDHEDRNPLNNRRDNLRLSTNSQNGANKGVYKNSKSGLKGVIWNISHQRWHAQIRIDGKKKHLGYFDTAEEAHKAYCGAAIEAFGEFANTGSIERPTIDQLEAAAVASRLRVLNERMIVAADCRKLANDFDKRAPVIALLPAKCPIHIIPTPAIGSPLKKKDIGWHDILVTGPRGSIPVAPDGLAEAVALVAPRRYARIPRYQGIREIVTTETTSTGIWYGFKMLAGSNILTRFRAEDCTLVDVKGRIAA